MRKHVYFIAAPTVGLVKIGVAVNVTARLGTLRSSCPVPLDLLGCIKNGGLEMESRLHTRFRSLRSHGEWFRHNSPLTEYITEQVQGSATPPPARQPEGDPNIGMAVRVSESKRAMLQLIQKREGHSDLSETIRAAVDEYLDRHLLRQAA